MHEFSKVSDRIPCPVVLPKKGKLFLLMHIESGPAFYIGSFLLAFLIISSIVYVGFCIAKEEFSAAPLLLLFTGL